MMARLIIIALALLAVASAFPADEERQGRQGSEVESLNGDGPLEAGLKSVGLNTLLGLIETAGLVDALSGEDALTVFAPTDAALKRFIDALPSAPDADTVKTVLLNHVISGSVKAGDLTDGMMAENLAGNKMTIRLKPAVTVGGARVAMTDLELLSLTVHTLDDVIDPAGLPDGNKKRMKGHRPHYKHRKHYGGHGYNRHRYGHYYPRYYHGYRRHYGGHGYRGYYYG